LLPGNATGFTEIVPRTTFTDPEVAHVGATESEARQRFGDDVAIHGWDMKNTDRAICENDTDGFIKVIARKGEAIIGVTILLAQEKRSRNSFLQCNGKSS
jgi:pyruvate/2-oxoglutarate dehydrogenase complex dihydrolipoamide dehydrogenase (E3) component